MGQIWKMDYEEANLFNIPKLIKREQINDILTMVNSWSYLVVVLCLSVTSSRVLHPHGNKERLPGNDVSDVRVEKLLTPPSSNGLIIDQDGYPGNSTSVTYVQISSSSSSGTPENYHNTPENTPNKPEIYDSSICHVLCLVGDGGNACMCDFLPANARPPLKNQLGKSKKPLWRKSGLPRWMYERQLQGRDIERRDSSTDPPICDTLCKIGEGGNACMCDWAP